MMRLKSFEIQEVREIGRKKAKESIGFPILWMEIIEDVFQMKEKECRDLERLKMCRRKSHARARKVLQNGMGNFVWASKSGQVRFVAAARNFGGEKGEQKDE